MVGNQCIHYALSAGSLVCVRLLLDSGAELDTTDRFERRALYLALKSESFEVVEFVLQRFGSDTDLLRKQVCGRDIFQQTALHCICQWRITKFRLSDDENDSDDDEDDTTFNIDLFDSPLYIKWK